MASVLNEAYFHDEVASFAALEGIMWPKGKPPHCPHCGALDRMNRLADQTSKPSKKHPKGKPVRGLWKCYHCRKQFTVRKNTVFEESRLELHQWFQAAFLMCSSKKGISANQLHRTLGCTLKTAWFVAHRLREAMREGDLAVPFDGLILMAANGRLKTVRQALDEVKKFDGAYDFIKAHRDAFQIETEHQYCGDVSDRLEYLGKNAGYLWPQTGGKNPDPADPWLVAVASSFGYTLVTNESPRKEKRIPSACKLPGSSCRCIRGPHFLVETKLVTEIKLEHIDPEGFFKA